MRASSLRLTDTRRQAGQSIVELAVATPVLLLMLLSAFNVGVLLSDKVTASYAALQGDRLAAELGGGPNGMTTSQVDQQIVEAVRAGAASLNYATITEIDVYAPSRADGSYAAGDPHDSYDGSGAPISSPGFPTSARVMVPPDETSIGVRLVWTYSPPTGV